MLLGFYLLLWWLRMSDLDDYFSQQDKIDQLQAEIKKLKTKINTESQAKLRYKKALEGATGIKEPTQAERAISLIKELKGTGKVGMLIKSISNKCFLSEARIKQLWYSEEVIA